MKEPSTRDRAIQLRKAGYSYTLIAEQVPVSKSTLSLWLAKISYTPNQAVINRIGTARAAAGQSKSLQKLSSYSLAEKLAATDVQSVTDRDLFMLGLALYIGEGEKNDNVGVINSDPRIIKLAISWLQKFYNVPKTNFTLAIHLYPDNNTATSLAYWSKMTGIPLDQFGKTQIDRRQNKQRGKRSKLPHGTAHLRVRALGNKQLGVLLARRIKAAMNIVLQQ